MSFAAGFAAGYAFAKKKFEGGGGGEYINNDPDYALYKALPEPAANQAVILMRIVDGTEKLYFSDHYHPEIPSEDISDYGEGLIDWGDGSIEGIGQRGEGYHSYSAPGDYVVTITDNSNGKIESVRSYKRRNYGYPIALKVGAEFIYDDGLGSKYINSSSGFKYIQFASDYFWENGFVFNGAQTLTRVDFLGGTKPDKLLNNQFDGCNALDFENLLPLFKEVTEVGNYVFRFCHGLKKLNLPKCSKVGNSSIYQCYSLTHVDLPLCAEIGNYAVAYNYALREANLPLCASVGNYGLAYDYALNKVVLPEGCSFGNNALNSCYCLIPTPNNIYPN